MVYLIWLTPPKLITLVKSLNSKIQNLLSTYLYFLRNDDQLAYFSIFVPFHLITKNLGIQWAALIKL
jgi:hypothetical protein